MLGVLMCESLLLKVLTRWSMSLSLSISFNTQYFITLSINESTFRMIVYFA